MASASELSFDDLPGGSDQPQRKVSARALSFDDLPGGDVSTGTDMGKAAAYALPKAAAGFMGLPRDLSDLGAAVRNKLTSYLPNDWQGGVNKVDSLLRGANPISALAANMPGSGQIRSNLEQTTGPWYDPQTRAGKITDVAVQTAATMGRNLVTTPVRAALTTAGMTTGNQVAGAMTGDNPWAMFAGSLVGGAPAVLANARVSAAPRALKQAIGGISQPEIDAAIARQSTANAQGVPLMGSESLPVSAIQPLTADIAASRSGGAVINPFLAKRPDQVRSAVSGLLNATAPETDPRLAAASAQKAATTVIGNAEQARTDAVSPFYKAAETEQVDPAAALQAYMQAQESASRFPPSMFPQQSAAIDAYLAKMSSPEASNASAADKLYQQARNESAPPEIGATAEQKNVAAAIGPIASALKQSSGSNPSIAQGRQLYQDITRGTIDPLTSGPMGVVAGKTGFDAGAPSPVPRVTSVLSNADTARPENIRPLYTAMNQVDPTAFPGLARTWLETAFDKATQRIQSGDNRMMGANFAKTVYGTDQERQNLREVLRGVANAHGVDPETFVAGADNLMQMLEATGKVPGIGSPTISRGALQSQLSRNPYSAVADFTGIPKTLGSMIGGAYNASRNKKIAEILTAPDSVQQIVKLAKLSPNGLTAKYYAAALLGLDRATTGQ